AAMGCCAGLPLCGTASRNRAFTAVLMLRTVEVTASGGTSRAALTLWQSHRDTLRGLKITTAPKRRAVSPRDQRMRNDSTGRYGFDRVLMAVAATFLTVSTSNAFAQTA